MKSETIELPMNMNDLLLSMEVTAYRLIFHFKPKYFEFLQKYIRISYGHKLLHTVMLYTTFLYFSVIPLVASSRQFSVEPRIDKNFHQFYGLYAPKSVNSGKQISAEYLPVWLTVAGASIASGLLLIIGLAVSQLTKELHHAKKHEAHKEKTPGKIQMLGRRDQVLHIHTTVLDSSEESDKKEKDSEEEKKDKAAKGLLLAKEIVALNAGSFLLTAHKIEFWNQLSRLARILFLPPAAGGAPLTNIRRVPGS